MTEKDNNKQTGGGQNSFARKALMWLSLTVFIIRDGFVSLGRGIRDVFIPGVDRRAGGRLSFVFHRIFAILTLEGPRLMLISRYRAARMEKGKKVGISAAGGTVLAVCIIASVFLGSQLLAITVDGKVIGYVENEGQYTSLLQQAKEKISKEVGTDNTEILIQDTNVSLDVVSAPQNQALTPASDTDAGSGSPADASLEAASALPTTDPAAPVTPAADPGASAAQDPAAGEQALVDSLIDSLLNDEAIKATVYTIEINDEVMATLGTLTEAKEVLTSIAESYTPTGGGHTGKFTDDVAINSITTELDDVKLQKPEDVVAYLLAGSSEERTYTATEGDSTANICAMLGISEPELRVEYPEYNFVNIVEGDTFSTTMNIPYIHYETSGQEISNDPVPFKTIEEKNAELYLGKHETKEEGVLGERLVTRFVTRVNGNIVASAEIKSELIKEPKSEIMYVGTKMVPMGDGAYVGPSDGMGGGGNGPLGRPLNSWYLSRSLGNGHMGADMLASQGTPIFAAERGTVTFVGVWGGYGNYVKIDHGNGLVTCYGHCDSFNTTEGAVVERGQQIATVGTTGRSTAYHLHFEVMVNGAFQEPLDWIE